MMPKTSYGVVSEETDSNTHVEQLRRDGFTVVESSNPSLAGHISSSWEDIFDTGPKKSEGLVRAPYLCHDLVWQHLALDQTVQEVLSICFGSRFVLLQQNAIALEHSASHSQSRWHRDIPYQQWLPSDFLAINALFAVDDFTAENGGTWLVPGSHKSVPFPSESYLKDKAIQITCRANHFVLMDAFLFHGGGTNETSTARRAVNHVFGSPILRHQIEMIPEIYADGFKDLLGETYFSQNTLNDFLPVVAQNGCS